LVLYYRINFALMTHYKYSLNELDNMIPYEREIYIALLQQWIKEENEKTEKLNRERKVKNRK